MTENKENIKIPSYNPHTNCPGHGIYMLDCEYEDKQDRDLLVKVLEHYTNEKNRI